MNIDFTLFSTMNSDLEKFGRFSPYCVSVLLLTKDDNDESFEIRNANKVDVCFAMLLLLL